MMTDFDEIIRALSDSSRRELLTALRADEQIRPFSDERYDKNQAIQLHHVHLPLLEETELVAWNQDTGVVKRGRDFEAAEPILTALTAGGEALPEAQLPEGNTQLR